MAIGFLSDFIKYTSDHTYQKATVESYSDTGQPLLLRGMSWNMLNLCHSKENTKYKAANNPFNLDELAVGYEKRKKTQINFLNKQVKSKTLDFIVLQEVDIFTGKDLPSFVSDFLIQLHDENWGAVHSHQLDDLHMPLLTLYDKSKLEFVSQKAILPRDSDGKKCALEATFVDKISGEIVCIVNMNLDYNTNHNDAILRYQQEQIDIGKFTVIGGDTNSDHYSNMAGDRLVPSCIIKPDGEPLGKGCLKRRDGFMANPPNSSATVTITEGVCGYFQWKPPSQIRTFLRNKSDPSAVGKFVFKILDPIKQRLGGHVKHISMPGAPFMSRSEMYVAVLNKI